MTFELGKVVNGFIDKLVNAPILSTAAKNPIYTALFITVILVLVVLFIFKDAETDESLSLMVLRAGFWMFIVLIGVLFVHDHILLHDNKDKNTQSEIDLAFTSAPSIDGATNIDL